MKPAEHIYVPIFCQSSTIQTFTRHLLWTVVQADQNDSIITRLLCWSSLHHCHADRSPIHSRRGAHPVTSHSGHQKPAPMNRGAADSGLNAGRRGGPPSNSSPAVTNPLVGCHMHTAEARYRSGEPRQATAGDRVGSPQKRWLRWVTRFWLVTVSSAKHRWNVPLKADGCRIFEQWEGEMTAMVTICHFFFSQELVTMKHRPLERH